MNKKDLRANITAAFAEVPYPGDDNIGSPDGRDDGETATELLRGKDWRSLRSSELWPSALNFLTPSAFHYFLPAYLLGSIEDDSGDVLDWVLSVITPHWMKKIPRSDEDFGLRYKNFTSDQRTAIFFLVSYLCEDLASYVKASGLHGHDELSTLQKLREFWEKL